MSGIREKVFSLRSYTPIPFIIVMVVFAEPSVVSLASGFAVVVLGELVRFWGVAYAGPLTRATGNVGAPALIVAGPFARVRNPLYVGNIVMYTGVGVMANALTPWLVLAALAYFILQYSLIVSLEEEFLEKEFGESFAQYRRSVPRYLPRITPFRTPEQQHQRPDWMGALRSERRTLQAIVIVVLILIAHWIWLQG